MNTYTTYIWTKQFSKTPKIYTKESNCSEVCNLLNYAFNTYSLYRENGPAVIVYLNNKKAGEIWITDDISHRVIYDVYSNKIEIEEYYKGKDLHRENDLPAVIRYCLNIENSISLEEWYINGKQHRENDLPAEIEYNKYSDIIRRKWYTNGKLHRLNNPAIIINKDVLQQNNWYINGKPFNIDSDLVYESYKEGVLLEQAFFVDTDLYYSVQYHTNGNKKSEEWRHISKGRHREIGPAQILYSPEGHILESNWYINGNNLDMQKLVEYYNTIRNAIIYHKNDMFVSEYAKLMKEESKTMFD